MTKNIAERIEESFFSFSKGQKRIAGAILNNYEKVAYMTAAKLGAFCEVSESTVVRFAAEIGYTGYPEMQNAVREHKSRRLQARHIFRFIAARLKLFLKIFDNGE